MCVYRYNIMHVCVFLFFFSKMFPRYALHFVPFFMYLHSTTQVGSAFKHVEFDPCRSVLGAKEDRLMGNFGDVMSARSISGKNG